MSSSSPFYYCRSIVAYLGLVLLALVDWSLHLALPAAHSDSAGLVIALPPSVVEFTSGKICTPYKILTD
jgi:hypothetical protein